MKHSTSRQLHTPRTTISPSPNRTLDSNSNLLSKATCFEDDLNDVPRLQSSAVRHEFWNADDGDEESNDEEKFQELVSKFEKSRVSDSHEEEKQRVLVFPEIRPRPIPGVMKGCIATPKSARVGEYPTPSPSSNEDECGKYTPCERQHPELQPLVATSKGLKRKRTPGEEKGHGIIVEKGHGIIVEKGHGIIVARGMKRKHIFEDNEFYDDNLKYGLLTCNQPKKVRIATICSTPEKLFQDGNHRELSQPTRCSFADPGGFPNSDLSEQENQPPIVSQTLKRKRKAPEDDDVQDLNDLKRAKVASMHSGPVHVQSKTSSTILRPKSTTTNRREPHSCLASARPVGWNWKLATVCSKGIGVVST